MSTQRSKPRGTPPGSERESRVARKNRQLRIFLIGLAILVAASLAGVFLYQSYLAPYQKVVIKVDSTTVRMGYFLKRLKATAADPSSMVQQLTYEQIIKITAAEFGAKISDAELDEAIRTVAAQSSANVTDNTTAPPLTESAFKEWYKKTLKDTGFSAAEYREVVRVNLLAGKLQSALAQQVPTSAAQVHLNVILVGSLAEANAAKARIDGGEPFASVASEVSLDATTKGNGGDFGWIPAGLLPYDETIFSLGVNEVSMPVANQVSGGTGQYLLFMVSEKADNRAIDADTRAALQSRALYDWLQQELSQHSIQVYLDEPTQAWVEWQLSRD